VHPWLTSGDFLDLFAVSRIMPGPGSFIATLIGWRVAGWLGAIVATLAIFLPSSFLCLAVADLWSKGLGPSWRAAVERGLVPIGAGLMFAGVYSVMRLSGADAFAWMLMLVGATVMIIRPKIHPLWLLLAGGAVSLVWAFAGGR
jgi:chromate transporter